MAIISVECLSNDSTVFICSVMLVQRDPYCL